VSVNQIIQIDPPNTITEIGGPVSITDTVASILYELPPPALPVIEDGCGNTLTPSPVVIGGTYEDGDCKGTITYTYTYTDCVDQTYIWVYTSVIDCGSINVRAFLQGAYDDPNDEMRTKLNDLKVLPGQDKSLSASTAIKIAAPYTPFGQPFQGAPWNFSGNLGDSFGDSTSPNAPAMTTPYPDHVVDWILVTVRENGILPANNVFTCAGWIHTNGDVTFPEACPDALVINPANDYYIVLEHRNHLPVLDTAIIGDNNDFIGVNFTQQNSYAPVFRFGQKEISPGVWGLYNANIDQLISRTSINSADQTAWKLSQNAYGYNKGDADMSTHANSNDETNWKNNQNKTTGVKF
jgi:hypothetical protein